MVDRASYVPGAKNVEADAESRAYHDNAEWSLNTWVFRKITEIWGVPDIDLFASRNNAKVEVFCAWKPDPEAQFIDAFTVSWSEYHVYAFPPFCLMGKLLQKITFERVQGIIVFP